METQKLFFKSLKDVKDEWVNSVMEGIENKGDYSVWSEHQDSYLILQQKLVNTNERDAFRQVLNEAVNGVIHSILVGMDGGSEISEHIRFELIDKVTQKSVNKNITLHEEYIGYILDSEEE